MREFDGNGKGRSFESAHASAPREAAAPRERTPETKAADAKTIASNLDEAELQVRAGLAAMAAAERANDRAKWDAAKRDVDVGIVNIRFSIEPALAAANDATDARVKERLAASQQRLKSVESAAEAASERPPAPGVAALSIAADLLDVLPPDHPVSPAEPVYAPAKLAVERVFRERLIESDIAAFRELLAKQPDHEIARRFRRFGPERQTALLQLLEKAEIKLPAREREQKRRRKTAAEAQASTSEPSGAVSSSDLLPEAELVALSPAEQAPPDAAPRLDRALATQDQNTAVPAPEPNADAAPADSEPPVLSEASTSLGARIAEVTGARHIGGGVFELRSGLRVEVQRGHGSIHVERAATSVVISAPRGLATTELEQMLIGQIRQLDTGETDGQLVENPSSASTPAAIAAQGTQGPGSALPHLAQIQASFGKHDVSRVRSFEGGPAARAADGLGAHAFAFGDAVGFKSAPDLHTAAHEAAHTVQQNAGVALKSALDEPGDAHEQHADAVADAVVSGESAEELLDQGPGHEGAAEVQRETPRARRAPATAQSYVNDHASAVHAALAERIMQNGLPEPHPRLRWRDAKAAAAGLAHLLGVWFENAGAEKLKRLTELCQPVDLFTIVNELWRVPGPAGCREEIGIAIAAAFDEPIAISLQRMGPRVRALLDVQTDMPSLSSLVANCKLDRVVGELLINPKFIVRGPKQRAGAVDDTPGRTFERGPRHVEYEWQGTRDPELWNWIRVKSPADATVEEVAQIPFLGGDVTDSEQAHRIAASPPYFGIPFETARRVPDALDRAPHELRAKLVQGELGPRFADRGALARSATGADDAALAQAPKANNGDLALDHALDRVTTQLAFLGQALAPWKAAKPLAPAIAFVGRRRAEVTADRRKAARWAPAVAAQERFMNAVASEMAEILREIRKAQGTTPVDPASQGPLVGVLKAYASACGVSHMHAESATALAAARQAAARYPLSVAEDRIRTAREAIAGQRATQIKEGVAEANAGATDEAILSHTRRAVVLKLEVVRHHQDDEALEELAVDAEADTLRAHILTLMTKLAGVEKRAAAAGLPQTSYSNGLPTLHAFPAAMRRNTESWLQWLGQTTTQKAPGATGSERKQRTDDKRAHMRAVAKDLETYKKHANLDDPKDNYFTWAARQIADKELSDLLEGVAAQLVILIATGQLIGAGFAALRGIAIGADVVAGMRGASVALKVGETAAHAVAATGVQAALGGHVGVRELGENTVAIVLGHAAMRPFRGLLERASSVEKEVMTLATRAARAGKFVAEGALETATGVAAGAVARMAVHGSQRTNSNPEEWITNAIAFAANRFIHQRAKHAHARIEADARERRHESQVHKRAKQLAIALERQTSATVDPKPEAALDALLKLHGLFQQEQLLYGGQSDPAQKSLDTDSAALKAEAAELVLHLAKVSPIVAGEIYEGSDTHIRNAVKAAKELGIEHRFDPTTGTLHLKQDERTIEVWKLKSDGSHTHDGATERVGAGFEANRHKGDRDGALPADAVDAITQHLPELQLDPANPIPGILAYLKKQLPQAGNLNVVAAGGGKSGAAVYLVRDGNRLIHVFKIFQNKSEMAREIAALNRIRDLSLQAMEPVEIGKAANVEQGDAKTGAGVMTPAKGDFVKKSLDDAGAATGHARTEAIEKVSRDNNAVAKALAEFHVKSASGKKATAQHKEEEISRIKAKWAAIVKTGKISAEDIAVIDAGLKQLYGEFRSADVDASYAHGDGHAGNFSVDASGKVSVIDTETLLRSIGSDGKGVASGAMDVGRFAESLRTFGSEAKLTPSEIVKLQNDFTAQYNSHYAALAGRPASSGFDTATKLYQANFTTIVLRGLLTERSPSSPKTDTMPAKAAQQIDALKAILGAPSRSSTN